MQAMERVPDDVTSAVSAKCRDDAANADAIECSTTDLNRNVPVETSDDSKVAAEGALADDTDVAVAVVDCVACNDDATCADATECNTPACNLDSHADASSDTGEFDNVKASSVAARTNNLLNVDRQSHAPEEYIGEVDNNKTAPKHLQWKTAITRNKRRLLAGTPGRSPALKKAAAGNILGEKS